MRRGWNLVYALAAAQLVSWGSIYYSFSLFLAPMEHELGWSRTALNGALSAGLLVSGFAAYPLGAWIDRGGGRAVMAGGSALAAAMLAAWAGIAHIGAFYLVWLGLGLALAATLYDPVFAVIIRLFPENYGTRITVLTLVGGFASTVFIPLTQALIELFGWRQALLALALVNAVIALPIHLFGLGGRRRPGAAPARPPSASPAAGKAFHRALRHPAFWGLAVSFTAYSATLSALTFHVIPLLTDRGIQTATIVAALAAYGPAQVAGRIVFFALGRRTTAALAGRAVLLVFPAAIAILVLLPGWAAMPFAFTVLWGVVNGIVTIVRGLAVPELVGREGYGAINGALALPANFARGLAPYGAALIWKAAGGYDAVLWTALVMSAVAAAGFWFAAWQGKAKNR